MTTLAHALSGALIAVTAGRIAPTETAYIGSALAAGAILDLDHVYPVLRDWKFYRTHGFRGNLHGARSPLHELWGLVVAGIAACALWPFDAKLAFVVFTAFAVHLIQDFIVGRSIPFSPADRTEVQMFAASFRQKVAIDVVVISLSVVLWVLFLNGRL